MAGMEVMAESKGTMMEVADHDTRIGVRPLVIGVDQFGRLYHFCVQLRQATK
jgi:hypothetical protein